MQLKDELLSKRDHAALKSARDANVKVFRQGLGWRFIGKEIDILAVRPGIVTANDLRPFKDHDHARLAVGAGIGAKPKGVISNEY